jgi:hypothetical protein
MVEKTLTQIQKNIKEKLRNSHKFEDKIRRREDTSKSYIQGHFLLGDIITGIEDKYIVHYRIYTNKRDMETRKNPIEVNIYEIEDYEIKSFHAKDYELGIQDDKNCFNSVYKDNIGYDYEVMYKNKVWVDNVHESFKIVFSFKEPDIDDIRKIVVSESLAGGGNNE